MSRFGLEAQLQIYGKGHPGGDAGELPIALEDWKQLARQQLADGPWGYLENGAGSEATMRSNRAAFERWDVRPRMLRDVDDRDLSIRLLGATLPVPFLLAPIGVQSILHADAELAPARAAAHYGIPFILSTVSSVDMETVADAMGGARRWFQLYPGKDPDIVTSMSARAERAGYSALVVTVDTTMLAWRETDLKHAYLPFLQGQGMANFTSDPAFLARLHQHHPQGGMQAVVSEFLAVYVNPAFTWADLRRIRQQTKLPLLVKGITHPEDARLAMDLGADGLIVSNHGGRQVDGAISALDALVDIRAALGPTALLLMDSGIRHATDLLKAVALGAQAVLLGRPYAYALAAAGETGVKRLLSNFMAELDLQLALSGYARLSDIDGSYVTRRT